MLLSRCWISFSNYPVKPQLGNGLGFCPGHTSIPNCCFCPRHMGTSIGKPAFPRTWAVHGPRGRTAIFHHGCLAQPLIFCPSHIFLTRRKLAFPVTWAVHRPRGRIVVFHHEHLDELLFTRRKASFPGDLGYPRTTHKKSKVQSIRKAKTACDGPRTGHRGQNRPKSGNGRRKRVTRGFGHCFTIVFYRKMETKDPRKRS
jgi:hypothetical protein